MLRLKKEYEEKLKILLLPKDPNDDKNNIWKSVEQQRRRSPLFAGDLTNVPKYAESQGWVSLKPWKPYNGVGVIKEVVAMASVNGDLKTRVNGAHWCTGSCDGAKLRVVHTSTATFGHARNRKKSSTTSIQRPSIDIYQLRCGGQNAQIRSLQPFVSSTCQPISRSRWWKNDPNRRTVKSHKIRARVVDHFACDCSRRADAERKSTIGTATVQSIRTYNFLKTV